MAGRSLVSFEPTAPLAGRLAQLGYSSLVDFLSAATFAKRQLTSYLGVDLDPILREIPDEELSEFRAALDKAEPESLGAVLLPYPERQPVTFAPALAHLHGLPGGVDQSPNFGPVRDQGERGTCVPFAVSAEVEWVRGTPDDFSEQFLYYWCKKQDGYPGAGTFLQMPYAGMLGFGICIEARMRYQPVNIPGNEGQGPPSPAAERDALQYRIASHGALNPRDVGGFKAALAVYGKCPTFAFPVFASWYQNPEVRRTGNIHMPVPGENPLPTGHAVCLVGYQDGDAQPGGGVFKFRNSWGSGWGAGGYGTLPYAYLSTYGNGGSVIGELA